MVTETRASEAELEEASVKVAAASVRPASTFPLRLQLPKKWEITDERFLELCALNEGKRIETDAEGGLLIMAPTGPLSSAQGGRIFSQTLLWSDANESGMVFESSATFMLPNGDRRMPDAAWISNERLAEIADHDEIIWQICPDFVVEVRSATDDLEDQQAKMDMWISQGARLGWLVDPLEESVWVYLPDQESERLERPESLTATEIADDLTIDLSRIWPQSEPEHG